MKNYNLYLNDPKDEDWNKFINHFHDPSLLYFYIKQIYNTNDIKEGLNEVPDNKKDSVASLCKLEVFRATMQYVEEFAMYFIAYSDNYENIGEKLVKTKTTEEVKQFFKKLVEGKGDEFSQEKQQIDFNGLLREVFGYNLFLKAEEYNKDKEKFNELIVESVKTINSDLLRMANYYLVHLRIYNAIKHGTRVFPVIQNQMQVDKKVLDDDPKNMIIAICKDKSDNAAPYTLIFPISYLIDKSFRITEKTHLLFEYLRNIIRNKLIKPVEIKFSFFKSISTDNPEKKYIEARRNKNIIIIETPDDFEYDQKPLRISYAGKVISRGKTIYLHTKLENRVSLEYPFLVKSELIFSSDLTPSLSENIKFHVNIFDLPVGQYLDLVKISGLQEKGEIKKIILVNDLTNEESSARYGNDLNLSDIYKSPSMDYLKFLSKLEKITGELIPVPRLTSKMQEQIIDDNLNKKLSKKDAEDIWDALKSEDSKMEYTFISTKILDSNWKEISSRTFDPIIGDINLDYTMSDQKEKSENLKDKETEIKMGINEVPGILIEKIELYVEDQNNKFPVLKHTNLPTFELEIVITHKTHFWYNEQSMQMIFKPVRYIQK